MRLAPEHIRGNALCPGPTDTPMLRVFVKRPDQPGTENLDVEELIYKGMVGLSSSMFQARKGHRKIR
jgi:NAD(P)-dependent dehydrogenase (short-subunit alcohol dehydrogenase family)